MQRAMGLSFSFPPLLMEVLLLDDYYYYDHHYHFSITFFLGPYIKRFWMTCLARSFEPCFIILCEHAQNYGTVGISFACSAISFLCIQ